MFKTIDYISVLIGVSLIMPLPKNMKPWENENVVTLDRCYHYTGTR
jgi:hypothetical protein